MLLTKKQYKGLDALTIPFLASKVWVILRLFSMLLLSLMVTAVMALATANFVDTATAILQKERPQGEIYPAIFLLLLVLGVSTTLGSVIDLVSARIRLDLRRKIKPEIVRIHASLDYKHIENKESWELISRVSRDPVQAIMNGFLGFQQMLDLVVAILGVLLVILAQVWWAAFIIIIFSVPMFWLSMRAGKKNYQAGKEAEKFNRRTEYLEEVLTGRENIEERSLFEYGSKVEARWHEQYEKSRMLQLRVRAKMFLITKGSSLILALIALLVAATLITPVVNGIMTAGMFMGIVTAVFGLIMKLGWQMSASLENISRVKEYMKDLTGFLELSQAAGALDLPAAGAFEFQTLEFKNVRFQYPSGEGYILDGLSFTLEKDRHYAFVGKNGAGKTTITKLLTGLYTEYEGEILINNKEIRTYRPDVIKSLFSVVYQDFVKYYIGLKDNILLGDMAGTNTTANVTDIIGMVGLENVVAGLKDGLRTPLGKIKEGGQDLSGGQWQRLAIARSLISSAPVKILDEPTAALDPISESQLYSEFEKLMGGKTTVFISHRLGSTKLADEILVIDDGKIKERGSHEELMALEGEYCQMFESQRRWYQ